MDVSRPRRLLLPAVVYALILALSSIPGSSIDQLGFPAMLSYLGHAIEYGLLGGALAWALMDANAAAGSQDQGLGRILIVVVVVVAMLGGVDELYQGTISGRETSLVDLGVDVVAASIACVVTSRRMAER